jgi:hypothetical protein
MGSYNGSFVEIAREIGYQGACTSHIGFTDRYSSRFLLPRIVVNGQYGLPQFAQIMDWKSDMIRSLTRRQKAKGIARRLVGERFYNFAYNRIYSIDA